MFCKREIHIGIRTLQQNDKPTQLNMLCSTKGEYIGCLEPAIEDSENSDLPSHNQQVTHSTNSVTTQRMMPKEVKLDSFHPPCHKLKPSIESELDALLKEYASQFMKDETSIGMTPLTEMTIDTGTSDHYLRSHTQLL